MTMSEKTALRFTTLGRTRHTGDGGPKAMGRHSSSQHQLHHQTKMLKMISSCIRIRICICVCEYYLPCNFSHITQVCMQFVTISMGTCISFSSSLSLWICVCVSYFQSSDFFLFVKCEKLSTNNIIHIGNDNRRNSIFFFSSHFRCHVKLTDGQRMRKSKKQWANEPTT